MAMVVGGGGGNESGSGSDKNPQKSRGSSCKEKSPEDRESLPIRLCCESNMNSYRTKTLRAEERRRR